MRKRGVVNVKGAKRKGFGVGCELCKLLPRQGKKNPLMINYLINNYPIKNLREREQKVKEKGEPNNVGQVR